MNTSNAAHDHYKKMIGMKGKFNVEFHNLSVYKAVTLVDGTHSWDEKTGVGKAELITKSGRILFEFSQVKKVY